MKRHEGPFDGVPGKALPDVGIVQDVIHIVQTYESAFRDRGKGGQGDDGQQNTDNPFQQTLVKGGIHRLAER
jgi:hypothetical protein